MHTPIEIENRYSRQLQCAEGFSQEALSSASVLVLGMGGLGGTVALHLAMAGVGELHVCDRDIVSLSNLNRQILYRETDLGKEKTYLACERLKEINPSINIVPYHFTFDKSKFDIFPKTSLIVDCFDSLEGRILAIQYAKKINTPLIHAAIHGFEGQLATFVHGKGSCPFCSIIAEDYYEDKPLKQSFTPALGACVGTLASLQASEAIKFLCDIGEVGINKIYHYDLLFHEYSNYTIEQNPNCIACSENKQLQVAKKI